MLNSSALKKLEEEISNLTLDEKLALVQRLTSELEGLKTSRQSRSGFSHIYGLGKGLWEGMDAQEYVNSMRQDRL